MTELVVADIGGTHARFAIADVADRRVTLLGEPVTLRTREYSSLDSAWAALCCQLRRPLPRAAALATASPFGAAHGGLTDAIWNRPTAAIEQQLGLEALLVLNDFAAVAHAVHHLGPEAFQHLCGPDDPLPSTGVVTICGPGTGLGCAQLIRRPDGYQVIETEGGHIGFAPADDYEDALVRRLREWHGRASAERVCSGPAILAHLQTVADARGDTLFEASERAVWSYVLEHGSDDDLMTETGDRFCAALGSIAGDLALAQGANAVVIAGGLGLRLQPRLLASRFAERFAAKGRFEGLMKETSVKLITHPQPGLYGAAAAFAAQIAN